MTRRTPRLRPFAATLAAGLLVVGGLAAGLLAAAWGLDRAFPPDLSRVRAVGTEVLDRQGRTLALLPAPGGVWRFAATPEGVSREFLDLLVATEDRRFWHHPGVDPLALGRAAVQWARAGRVVSGGSTLSMQAARLLEPRPRTVRAKLIEMARAVQLEWRYGKSGVLGIWLTLAPYGGNLEGVRAGSWAWFGVKPGQLDPAQAALLVAIPRRPEALRPDRHPERARALRDRVLAEAAGTPVPDRRLPLPRNAPQAVAALGRASSPASPFEAPFASPTGAFPGAPSGAPIGAPIGATVRTTLDLPLQAALERLARERLHALPERVSVSVVVADWRAREVRALVSGAWGEEARAGALDLTRAVRSPGSALKPFLYALAFQDGAARPDTVMADLPRRFGDYAPENFGGGHAGSVTAAEALRRSLNLPAVALLDAVGPQRFAQVLRLGGAKPRLPIGADPALPLALGGAGVTLREMVALYAGLAADGLGGPLRVLPAPTAPPRGASRRGDRDAPRGGEAPPGAGPAPGAAGASDPGASDPGAGAAEAGVAGGGDAPGRPRAIARPGGDADPAHPFLHPEAARLVAGILTRPFPGGGPAGVAWKTGTSWGGRDAWAFGFDGAHAAGVWVGRPDGTPLPGATGRALALPLLAAVFERLPAAPRPAPAPVVAARGTGGAAPSGLRLVFPPAEAVLSADGPVTLRATGGRRPLVFLVDGAPVPAEEARRQARWTPPGPGFYRLTVLDADGEAVRAAVRVR